MYAYTHGQVDAAFAVFDDLVAPSGQAQYALGCAGTHLVTLSPMNWFLAPSSSIAATPDPGETLSQARDLRNLGPRHHRIYALRPFAIFLKGMIDYLDNLSEENVR